MKIEDIGFIISIKKFEENSLLVKILSKDNGIISGYVKHIKKNRNDYQMGNLVKIIWSAKSIEQLGTMRIELIRSYLSNFLYSRFYLHLIESISILLNTLIYERFECDLFDLLTEIFDLISLDNKIATIEKYLLFENRLLNIIGTGIIFDREALENLYYISPKTGLAVSKAKGEPYRDRLLLLPPVFKNMKIQSRSDIYDGFEIMNFFLRRYFNDENYQNKYKNVMLVRENILNNIDFIE